MPESKEVGRYVLPILPSIEGIGPEIDRKMGRAFGSMQKQASQALAGGVRDGVAEAEAAIKRSSESIAKLRDKEAAAVDKLAAAEARVEELREKGGSALKRAEAQRNAADRARLAALRDIETQTRSLERAQESLNDAQSESARAGAQSGAGFLSGMRGQLAGAGSVGSEAASSFAEGFAGSSALLSLGARGGPVGIALAAVGVVAGGVLVQNVLAGIEREPARDLIQARLRLDDASMAVVGQEAAKAYVNNFGDSVQDNLGAAQLAIQGGLVAGATDPELDGVIAKIQAISQYVEGDLAQTTKSASILLRSGLAGSAEEAFDIIAAGYSMTGDLGGDFLDSIGEYSSGWKNAGLSATQALALIKQGSELGVDVTDRSADALREFGRRVSENGEDIVTVLNNIGLDGEAMFDKFKQGGPAGFEAFDMVFDRIRAIEDPTRRTRAAMALLGDTAGDFIDAFAQWDPSAAVDSFGRIEGAAQDAADTMGDNTAGAFESAKRSIELSLDTVQDKLALEFAPILKDAAGQVTENADLITDGFVLGGQAITHFAGITVGMLGGVTQAFGLFAGGIGNVLGGILKTGSALQRLTGDTETADQWNREADAMFGWGEDAQETGGKLIDLSQSFKGVADSLGELGDESGTTGPKTDWWGNTFKDADTDARNAAESTSALGRSIGDVGTAIDRLPANVPPWYETLLTGGGTGPVNPLLGPLGGGGGGIPGAGGLAPGSQGSGPGGAPGGLAGLFPGITPGGGGRGVLMNLQLANQAAGGGGAEQWRPLVQQALAAYGPAAGITNAKAWEDALVRQIGTESGGNPGSVNNNDSNGQGGRQRVAGLLNFLESTYNAHNVTGLPYMDPFGQIAAAIDYTAKKWGVGPDGSPNQIGRGKGFRHGGKATGPGGIDNVPAWLTAGEWVNTVDATRNNLPWLEAMNNGLVLPRFEQGGLVPELEQVKRIAAGFGLQVSSSLRPGDGGYHGRGLALDLSNGSGNTPQMLAFAQYMAANFGGELAELIYDAPGWSSNVKDGRGVGPFGQFYTMAQAGDHTDHVHVAVDGAGSGQVQALGNSPLAGVMPSMGPGSAQLTSAFGAGYQPGQGTPGYNDLGEPGYYQTDPRQIAQADRRAADAQENIADADQRIADAKAARADLEDDLTATAEQRAKADRAIADAEKAASRAREDAVWAQQDAAEARQGRFTAARKASQKKGAGGANDLSPLGGIFGSFFKESLGLDGTLFPDPSQLGIVKLANAILGIGFEPQEGVGFPWQTGYAGGDGTPWSGNPFAQPGAPGEGGGTSGLPFGMIPAAIDAAGRAGPGMAPPGTPASGIGGGQLPGPVDQSRNVSIQVDSGPSSAEIGNVVRREVASVDRLNTYVPKGA